MDSLLRTSSPSQQPIIKDQATPPPQAKSPDEVVVLDSGGGERRPSRFRPGQVVAEQLPCPRCDSTNTKFCYYNNYNLSQPRHFCKSCRRYWTRGGALRNIPVGGATRKPSSSNKRPRVATTATPTSAAAAPTSSNSNSNNLVSCASDNDVTGQTRALEPVFPDPVPALAKSVSSNFWLSSAQMGLGGGLLPFNGYGIGLGPLVGDESRVLDWSMEPVVVGPGRSTWQMGGDDAVEGGERAEADYFSWPELAMSKPAEALK